MSGYKDSLTGQMVTAGSPDTLMCLDLDFSYLLGDSGKPIIGIKKAKELAKDAPEILSKLILAEQLIIAAQRLFCYPTYKGQTSKEMAEKACEILKVNI